MSNAMRRTAASRRIVALVKGIQALARDLRAEVPANLNEGSECTIRDDLETAEENLRFWREAFRIEKARPKYASGPAPNSHSCEGD